jgi:hypothetical protein
MGIISEYKRMETLEDSKMAGKCDNKELRE